MKCRDVAGVVRLGGACLCAFPSVIGIACVLSLAGAHEGVAQERSSRKVSGIVSDPAGAPVPYAYVAIGANNAVTDGAGRFTASVPRGSGQLAILVRRIGFRPADTVVSILVEDQTHVITLHPIGAVLDTVRIDAISGYDEYLDRSGYYRRLANKVDGTFISAEQIERRNALEVSGVLRDVSGVRIVTTPSMRGRKNYALGRGGLCALGLVVDGRRVEIEMPSRDNLQPRITSMSGGPRAPATTTRTAPPGAGTLDEMVPLSMIGAIEIYPSASSVPNSLAHHVDGCGLIVVWTRYQERRP